MELALLAVIAEGREDAMHVGLAPNCLDVLPQEARGRAKLGWRNGGKDTCDRLSDFMQTRRLASCCSNSDLTQKRQGAKLEMLEI